MTLWCCVLIYWDCVFVFAEAMNTTAIREPGCPFKHTVYRQKDRETIWCKNVSVCMSVGVNVCLKESRGSINPTSWLERIRSDALISLCGSLRAVEGILLCWAASRSSAVSDLRLSTVITLLITALMGQSTPRRAKDTLLQSSQLHRVVELAPLLLCYPLSLFLTHTTCLSHIFCLSSLFFLHVFPSLDFHCTVYAWGWPLEHILYQWQVVCVLYDRECLIVCVCLLSTTCITIHECYTNLYAVCKSVFTCVVLQVHMLWFNH